MDQTLYDPARRRRRARAKRRMPAGLKRYWAARRGRKSYHPARRRRRRSIRLYDPIRRRFSRRRSRRYDPGVVGIRSPFMSALAQPILTTIGGWMHNWLVNRRGILAGSVSLGGLGNATHAGLFGGILGAVLEYVMPGRFWSSAANCIGSGMMAEGINLPLVEGVATPQAMQKATGTTGIPSEAYMPVPV